jgi:hypothetical protein
LQRTLERRCIHIKSDTFQRPCIRPDVQNPVDVSVGRSCSPSLHIRQNRRNNWLPIAYRCFNLFVGGAPFV